MSANLQLRDYLDNSTEASKRIRTILTILVVVTVLILAGFLNTWHGYAWNRKRIGFQEDYIKQLKVRIGQLTKTKQELISNANDFTQLQNSLPSLLKLKALSPYFGSEKCENLPENGATREKSEEVLNEQIHCYEGAIKLSEKFRDETIKAYVDNVYFIRVPFFGVAFDINDLGSIGGLSLIVILIMLRLNLRNFIVSLRIGFKAARNPDFPEFHEQFYDVLAGRQLFAFPDLEDSEQDLYEGKLEAIWNQSKAKHWYEGIATCFSSGFSKIKKALWRLLRIVLRPRKKEAGSDQKQVDSSNNNGEGPEPTLIDAPTHIETIVDEKKAELPKKDDASLPSIDTDASKKKGWYSNRHPVLALVPTWICLVPAIVYGAVVINDFRSYEVGMVVSTTRTISSFLFSLFCLVVIFGLGCWCVSKWIEIDQLWKIFRPPTRAGSSPTPPSEIHADGDNSNAKPVAPVTTIA